MSKVVEFNPKQKRVLITHVDLDGITCGILYAKAFPGTETYFSDYDEVNEVVMQLLSVTGPEVPVMISDLSVNAEVAEMLNDRGNVELVDHHPSAKWLAEKYEWAFVDTKESASYWLYDLLSQKFNLLDYKPLADITNDYDTWGHNTEPKQIGKDLTKLIRLMGKERFFHRFLLEATPELSDIETAILQLDHEREQEYINESLAILATAEDAEGYKYALLAADQYTSTLGHEILKALPEIEYVIMINFRKDRANLRGRGNVDLSQMAKSLGGGGHKRAAGFPLQETTPHIFFANCDGKCHHTAQYKKVIELLEKQIHDLETHSR